MSLFSKFSNTDGHDVTLTVVMPDSKLIYQYLNHTMLPTKKTKGKKSPPSVNETLG